MPSGSLIELAEDYKAAVSKLRRLGVRVAGSRLEIYERRLRKFAEFELAGDESHQGSVPFLLLLYEVLEIIEIASLPEEYFGSEERARLRMISGGPVFAASQSHDPGRDFALEFAVAASLENMGTFGGFSKLGGDITFGEDRRPLECKRISSIRKIEARLRHGRRQLQNLHELGGGKGAVLIDVSAPVFARFGTISASNDSELANEIDQRLTSFLFRYVMNSKHDKAIAAPCVLGVVARCRGIGTSGSASVVRQTTAWQSWSFWPSDSTEGTTFNLLLAGVGPGSVVQGTLDEAIQASCRFGFS